MNGFLDSPTAIAFWHDAGKYGIDLVGAIIILLVGWWFSGWAARSVRHGLSRYPWMDATLVPLLASTLRYTIIIAALLAVLGQFGIQLTSLVAVLGAAGLAIGLALQGTLSNVAAGVMLIVLRPFHIGDEIEAAGFTGIVEEVGLFATVIRSKENRIITVPNKMLSDAPVINSSRLAVHVTQNIVIQLSYNANLANALKILQDVATEHKKEAALVGIDELGDASVKVRLQVSTLAKEAETTKLSINLAIREKFAAAGIRFLQESSPGDF